MDKRTWIILIIFAVFLLLYQFWLSSTRKTAPAKPDSAGLVRETATTATQGSSAPGVLDTPEARIASPAETVKTSSPESGVKASAPVDYTDMGLITVKTPFYTMRLTRRGGRLYSLALQGFKGPRRKADSVVIVRPGSEFLATWFDASLIADTGQDTFFVDKGNSLRIGFVGPGGKKFYTLDGNGYTFSLWLEGPDTSRFYMTPSLAVTERDRKADINEHSFLYFRNGKLKNEPVKKVMGEGKGTPGDGLRWFGYKSKYFLFACVIQKGAFGTLEATALEDSARGIGPDTSMKIEAKLSKTPLALTVYAGPLDYDILRGVGYGLEDSYSFGFWLIAPFARFVFVGFRWLFRFIPNYGWVILLFSLLMKIAFSPLSYKTFKSMKKMQDLKPKMDALKKKYKDNSEEMNKAIMELYKGEKVNPLSGCFPVLLQLPIFWALYQVLKTTIDLRASPWVFWIHDLSVKDPYYILPIVMGAISLLNGFLQPSADRQAKLTSAVMAGVFTFIFLNFPAGIVLYWLSYNLYSIAEQAIFRRMLKKTEAQT